MGFASFGSLPVASCAGSACTSQAVPASRAQSQKRCKPNSHLTSMVKTCETRLCLYRSLCVFTWVYAHPSDLVADQSSLVTRYVGLPTMTMARETCSNNCQL